MRIEAVTINDRETTDRETFETLHWPFTYKRVNEDDDGDDGAVVFGHDDLLMMDLKEDCVHRLTLLLLLDYLRIRNERKDIC